MNSSLLQILQTPSLERDSSLALIREFLVDPRAFPYLVSASKSPLLWIEKPLGNLVRAFIRRDQDMDLIFQQIVREIVRRGVQYQYGNLFPFTEEGIEGALGYVSYFLGDGDTEAANPLHQLLELLVPENSIWAEKGEWGLEGAKIPVQVASWLPSGTAVAVPRDRGFLGDLHLFGSTSCAVVVHNPSRGVAVAQGSDGG